MKKLSKKNDQKTKETFQKSRKEFNDRLLSFIENTNAWKLATFISLFVAFGSVGGIIHLGSQSRFVPYIVQVDQHGYLIPIRPAEKAYASDPRIIKSMIDKFITSSRTITPDVALQTRYIFDAYSMVKEGDASQFKLNAFLNPKNGDTPFVLSQNRLKSVQIQSIMPLTNDSWQADWIEVTYARDGEVLEEKMLRAVLNIYHDGTEGVSEEELRANPLGVYISDYNVTTM